MPAFTLQVRLNGYDPAQGQFWTFSTCTGASLRLCLEPGRAFR
ncbi:MAG: hypothetical protein AB1921_05695 [Thermodesulfobacteriota bacterium]